MIFALLGLIVLVALVLTVARTGPDDDDDDNTPGGRRRVRIPVRTKDRGSR